ncbi:PREDICTED: uncharacterized protein LOC104825807 [Tarenaya hassleriana]|uniref:uncharacterized protein LOC104825807 n=1 Tax=Tarenaya hassleriana TaxID=28532 RepID=UPI0008FD7934|nr:PREDICTED: uncharacterized protein LOC104825807 [Tarenaya hassleriana]
MSVNRAKELGLPLMNLVRFRGIPILQQLHLEEKLLRTFSGNWCIINDGTNAPAIVMGMSGKPYELLELGSVIRDQIPVIKRFTGGGTVIVDKDTVFVSLICNKDDVPGVQPYPRSLLYLPTVLHKVARTICELVRRFLVSGFFLVPPWKIFISSFVVFASPDYVFGDHKFGGNAQSITRNRWIHHTSFLWDYSVENMAYLKLPSKAPQYRLERDHTDFVCRMKDYMQRSVFIEKTMKAVETHFTLKQVNLEEMGSHAKGEYLETTRLLTMEELEQAREGASQIESIAHAS